TEGFLHGQCVSTTLGNDRTTLANLFGPGHTFLTGEATFTIGMEEDGTVHVSAVAVTLPLPYLCDRCRQSGCLRHCHHLRMSHSAHTPPTHACPDSHSQCNYVMCHQPWFRSGEPQISPRFAASVTSGW